MSSGLKGSYSRTLKMSLLIDIDINQAGRVWMYNRIWIKDVGSGCKVSGPSGNSLAGPSEETTTGHIQWVAYHGRKPGSFIHFWAYVPGKYF